jgi:hypothetical protein
MPDLLDTVVNLDRQCNRQLLKDASPGRWSNECLTMLGMAIKEQSQKINKILRGVNAAVMNHSSKAVDTGEKLITEYGHYRY